MRTPNIFVSYASDDKVVAKSIAVGLRNLGYGVFFDESDLPPGKDYDHQIETAVKQSDGLIFVVSKASLSAGRYTLTELSYAERVWPAPSGRVLPVMTEEVDIGGLPAYLRSVSVLQAKGNLTAETLSQAKQMWPVKKWPASLVTGALGLFVLAVLLVFGLSWDRGNGPDVADRQDGKPELNKQADAPKKEGGAETSRQSAAEEGGGFVKVTSGKTGLLTQWSGSNDASWWVYKPNANGDYEKLTYTSSLRKGQEQLLELAPGKYRLIDASTRGFKPQDITIVEGKTVELRPEFGSLVTQWNGATNASWWVHQLNSVGEYPRLTYTASLRKGQEQKLDLAPGTYRLFDAANRGYKPQDITITPGKTVEIRPEFGSLVTQWNGATDASWWVHQRNDLDEYPRLTYTASLRKGQEQRMDLAPGKYRLIDASTRGFKNRDITITPGKTVEIRPEFGSLVTQWNGSTDASWWVHQRDELDEYPRLTYTASLRKGQEQRMDLAPGKYRLIDASTRGFKNQDITITPGEIVEIRPNFGSLLTQWSGPTDAYWWLENLNSIGEYQRLTHTASLKNGQEQILDLAPGKYRLVDGSGRGLGKQEIVIQAGKTIEIRP